MLDRQRSNERLISLNTILCVGGLALALVIVLKGWSNSRPVDCNIAGVVSHGSDEIFKFEHTIQVYRRTRVDDIHDQVTSHMRKLAMALQADMGLPEMSRNEDVLYYATSFSDDPQACLDGETVSVQVGILSHGKMSNGSYTGWSQLMASQRGEDIALRTQKGSGEYIEILLGNEDLAYLLGYKGVHETPVTHPTTAVPNNIRDEARIVATFGWSSPESKGDVMKALGAALRIKWLAREDSFHQGALFLADAHGQDEFFEGSLIKLLNGNVLDVVGLVDFEHTYEAVSGTLYWR